MLWQARGVKLPFRGPGIPGSQKRSTPGRQKREGTAAQSPLWAIPAVHGSASDEVGTKSRYYLRINELGSIYEAIHCPPSCFRSQGDTPCAHLASVERQSMLSQYREVGKRSTCWVILQNEAGYMYSIFRAEILPVIFHR